MAMNIVTLNVYPITVSGSTIYRGTVAAPPRGVIRKAQIIQFAIGQSREFVDDKDKPPSSDFTSTFYNSAVACPPGNHDPIDPALEAAGQLCAPLAATGGNDRYLDASGNDGGFFPAGIPYENADLPVDHSEQTATAPLGTLYLKIETTGTMPVVFGVFLMIEDNS